MLHEGVGFLTEGLTDIVAHPPVFRCILSLSVIHFLHLSFLRSNNSAIGICDTHGGRIDKSTLAFDSSSLDNVADVDSASSKGSTRLSSSLVKQPLVWSS